MDNMTGAEKAKEIRNSIFALLIAFIWNIILLIFKKWTKLRTLQKHLERFLPIFHMISPLNRGWKT